MIKRLIFDLDNTLIIWKDEYLKALRDTIIEYDLNVDYVAMNNFIEVYEKECGCYSEEKMASFLTKKLGVEVNIDFINKFLFNLKDMADVDYNVIDTLKYLSKKYELVVLTNWFRNSQVGRLKKAKIYEYFKEVYGGEEYLKPSLESFKIAIGDKKKEECIMIGDALDIDIKGALDFGMDAILIDSEDKYEYKKKIKKFNDLKEIL